MTKKYTKADRRLANRLWNLALDGTIQAGDARRLMPHNRTEWHSCQSVATAFSRLTSKAYDACLVD